MMLLTDAKRSIPTKITSALHLGIILKMTSEQLRQEIVSNRHEILANRKEIAFYKHAHADERKRNTELNTCIKRQDTEIKCLREELREEKGRVSALNKKFFTLHVGRQKKHWKNIKNEKTRRKRIIQYKTSIKDHLTHKIPDCEKAHITLSICGKTVKFHWIRTSTNSHNTTSASSSQSSNDHNYSSQEIHIASTAEPSVQSDVCQIFDDSGKFKKKHKQGIIYVMDNFRISHQAYHELYMQSKGFLPSIGQIIREKRSMSEIIPYYKHDQVRNV